MIRPSLLLASRAFRCPLPQLHVQLRLVRHRLYSSAPKNDSEIKEDPIPVQSAIPPVPLWNRLGPLTAAANAYSRSQKQRPWATQFITTVIIYFIADLTAQSIGGDEYNPQRTARNVIIGGVSAIPTYYWFLFLSHNFNYPSRIVSIATKVLVNLVFWSPAFNAYFFGAQALLSGSSLSGVVDRMVYAVPIGTVNSWKFWPFVTAFSFTYIPIEFRSVFASVIAIGWQAYLAWLNRKAELIEANALKSKPESPATIFTEIE